MHARLRTAALAASFLMIGAAPALAGKPLIAGPVYVGTSHNAACRIVNVTDTPFEATIEVVNATNNTVFQSGTHTLTPGVGYLEVAPSPGNPVYCRFSGVRKTKVRATLTVYPLVADFSDKLVIPAQ